MQKGLLKARTCQRTDSTHVLGAVRELNRLTMVIETLRRVLNELAVLSPEWLRSLMAPDWFDRYVWRADDFHLPTARKEREALARQVGQDGWKVLEAVDRLVASDPVRHSERIILLRAVWAQQYELRRKTMHWRKAQDLPANADLLVSPEDPEVRLSTKRDADWIGYKVHVTETCDPDLAHLITHIETMPATSQDDQALLPIQTALRNKGLLPSQQMVDAGYTSSFRLVDSQEQFGIELVGKVALENSWQAQTPEAFPLTSFTIDFERKRVTCPAGQQTSSWRPGTDKRGQPFIRSSFRRSLCLNCALRPRCTRGTASGRALAFRPQPQQLALQAARKRQNTEEFKAIYAQRAGVEGTLSQAIRRSGLRCARYRGMQKTHLQHIFIALAVNLVRVFDWFAEKPFARTRQTPFAKLALSA
jgi:transposase